MKSVFRVLFLAVLAISLMNCAGEDAHKASTAAKKPEYPMRPEDARKLRNGKLTGEGGLKLFGGDNDSAGSASPIGVNSFLWRATLDTLTFMPIVSADPFGGVILTDWYEDPKAPGERFKITALILDTNLRSDAIKVTVHKQKRDDKEGWRDQEVNKELGRKLEDTILTRARELRVKQGN